MGPLQGILLKVASVLVFVTMASLIKATDGRVPPGEVVFFRSLCAVPIIVAWLAWRRELSTGFRAVEPLAHLWRGFVGTAAMGLGFAGLMFLPLTEVKAIGYAAPLLTVVFAAMFLGEQVRLFRITAVGVGMVGVLIVLAPRLTVGAGMSDTQALGAMLVLGSAVFAALAQVFVRRLVQTESTSAIVFWFSLTATALSLITLPFGWVVPGPGDAMLLILAGLLGGVGQVLLTSSYRHADASVIAPFEYVSILFALGIGFWIFDEAPTLPMLGGAALVVAAGVMIIWRERQLGLERSRQRKVMTPQG